MCVVLLGVKLHFLNLRIDDGTIVQKDTDRSNKKKIFQNNFIFKTRNNIFILIKITTFLIKL